MQTDFDTLMRDWNVQIHDRKNWRTTYPNVGELAGFSHLGRVQIYATNGLLALYQIGVSETLWLGHLAAFTGPIAKDYVCEEDWDEARRRRKVSVFRRADGSYAIIPQDSLMAEYWSKHARMSKGEKECYERLGQGLMKVSEFDASLAQLRDRLKKTTTKPKSLRKQMMKLLEGL